MDELGLTCFSWGLPLALLLVVWLTNKVVHLTSRLTGVEERIQAIEGWLPTLRAAVAKEGAPEREIAHGKDDETPETAWADPSEARASGRERESEVAAEGVRPSSAAGAGAGEPPAEPPEVGEGVPPESPTEPFATPSAEPGSIPVPSASPEPVPHRPSPHQESPSPESSAGWSSLEESLGARLPVWLGAIALALAGAFLVKYSVEQGWLRPVVRVALGVSFGLGLEAAAILLRRSADRIAAGLAAAGIAVLYASFLAAVHLYSLLPPVVGFALMAVTTMAAVALSLIHGPIVAVVGMIGGFLTPYWLSADDPEAPRLFTYLLLLHAGLLAVSRKRSWPLLPLASLAICLLWVAGFLGVAFQAGEGPWLIAFLLLALASWLSATGWASRGSAEPGEDGAASLQGGVATLVAGLAALGLAGSVTWADGFDGPTWGMVILLTAGLVFLGRWRSQLEALAWLAALGVFVLGEAWKVAPGPDPATELVLGELSSLGLILVGGGLAAVRGAPAPERWASFAALSGLFLFRDLITWKPEVVPFGDTVEGFVALALAAIFAVAAARLGERFGGSSGEEQSLSTMAKARAAGSAVQVRWVLGLSATLFACWGIYFLGGDLGRTVFWALLAAFLAWLAGRPRVRGLAWLAVVPASLAFADMLASELLLLYPDRLSDPLLETWLRVAPFLAAMIFSIARTEGEPVRGLPGAGRVALTFRVYAVVALTVLTLCSVQVLASRGTSNPFVLDAAGYLALLALALALLVAAPRWPAVLGRVERVGALALTGLALCLAIMHLIVDNPVWSGDPVGTLPVLNHLLWVYGGVAVFAVLVARHLPQDEGLLIDKLSWFPSALYLTSLACLFFLVTLEILQAFRGSDLSVAPAAPLAERWALSVGWLLLGVCLLLAGIAARSRLLRAAALSVTGLAVVKVFLIDIGRLGDLYRVLSFLGLGLSLLLLAWLYQRFVFLSSRKPEAPGR